MDYIPHLSKDPRMRKLIAATGPLPLTKDKNVFLFLCRSVISQQLSTKVARIIEERFLSLLKLGKQPSDVLAIPVTDLRTIGLSATKASYLHNIARYFEDLGLQNKTFSGMEDEAVIELLTQIKGVGRWTAEMTLMFSLGREDVFSVDDYGIRQGMIAVYGLDPSDNRKLKEKMQQVSLRWAPYRSYACLHLWRSRDMGL